MTVAEMSEPGGRAPAPARLRLVQQLLNTNDVEGGHDAFASTPDLRTWLVEQRLVPPSAGVMERDRDRGIALREALRGLLIARDEGGTGHEATAELERISGDAGLYVRMGPDGWQLGASRSQVDAVWASVIGDVSRAMSDGSWRRLKACRRDACRWVFWDASRNLSGEWCSMRICGNRMKGVAFRDRQGRRRSESAAAS
jgi:predicted RNA-binding Zn ribbon-like protein